MFTLELGKGIRLAVTDEQLAALSSHDAVVTAIWEAGLTHILRAVHAAITEKVVPVASERRAQAEALVIRKFKAMLNGDIRVNRAIATADPVEREAARLARIDVHNAIKDDPTLMQVYASHAGLDEADEKAIRAAMVHARAAKREVIEQAQRNVEMASKVTQGLKAFL